MFDIVVRSTLQTTITQSAFLGNNYNKSSLIQTLSSDDDVLIVSVAVYMAKSVKDQPVLTVVIDFDFLVIFGNISINRVTLHFQ